MGVIFQSINRVIIQSFFRDCDIETRNLVTLIGKEYFALKGGSEKKRITLRVPEFTPDKVQAVVVYLKRLDFFCSIFLSKEVLNYQDTFLYSINELSSLERLNYKEQVNYIIKWQTEDNVTYTNTSEFLPVFITGVTRKQIKYYWEIFRLIRNNVEKISSRSFPVLIDPNRTSIFVAQENKKLLLYKRVEDFDYGFQDLYLKRESKEELEELLESFDEACETSDIQIVLRYPYYHDIDADLYSDNLKCFELIFQNRLLLKNNIDLEEDTIYFLPQELKYESKIINPQGLYEVVKTGHNQSIYNLINEIKSSWKEFSFNIYTQPFPKYFFLFINQSKDLDSWINLFKKVYYSVSSSVLYPKVEQLIKEIYSLNWQEAYFKRFKNIHVVFPSLENNMNRSKVLSEAFLCFIDYLEIIGLNVSYSEYCDDDKVNIILNSFNINSLISVSSESENIVKKVIIPDFLYFNLFAFGQYCFYNYQYNALYSPARLVSEVSEELIQIQENDFEQQNQLLQLSRAELNQYKDFYLVNDVVAYEDENSDQEKVILEIDLYDEVQDDEVPRLNKNYTYKALDKELLLTFKNYDGDLHEQIIQKSDRMYCVRNNYIVSRAIELEVGDFILDEQALRSKIISIIKKQLQDIPDSVKYYKYSLSKESNIFNRLRRQGLDISTEHYFKEKYIIDSKRLAGERFSLPRERDRNLICKVLNIDKADMQVAYIIQYKLRGTITRLYESIFDILFQEGFQILSSKDFESKVKEKVLELKLERVDTNKVEEFTKIIIQNIENQLRKFVLEILSIKEIKKNEN